MRTSASLAGMFVAAIALAGCAQTSPADAFISSVRESVPQFAEATSAEITDLGEQVCGVIDAGDGYDGLVAFIEDAKQSGLSATEAGSVAGAAVAAYCPEFSELFE